MKAARFAASWSTLLMLGAAVGCAAGAQPGPVRSARVPSETRRESSLRVVADGDDTRPAPSWEANASTEVVFSAVGRRPNFRLELDDEGGLKLGVATLRDVLFLPHVVRRIDPATSTTRLQGDVSGHTVQVEFIQKACLDPADGESFPFTVLVRVDTQLLQGCGRGEP